MEIATKMPVTMTPSSRPPSISRPLFTPKMNAVTIGNRIGIAAGMSISRCADAVTMRTHRA